MALKAMSEQTKHIFFPFFFKSYIIIIYYIIIIPWLQQITSSNDKIMKLYAWPTTIIIRYLYVQCLRPLSYSRIQL